MKFGIVGTNFISDRFIDALRRRGHTPHAVFSRAQSTGDAFAARHAIPCVYTDLDALCASDVDAVYVASPNYAHGAQATRLLQSGKSVLLEKPATPSFAEWEALWAVAKEENRKSGVVLMEAMRPHYESAYALIASTLPRLGAIRRVTLEFCQYSSRYDAFLAGEVKNTFNPALGNAALLDIGIYPLHIALMLFGKPKTVQSDGFFLQNGFEGGGTVLLGYDGFCAEIIYSKVCNSVTPSVLCGERGALTIDKLTEPKELLLYPNGAPVERLPHTHTENNMVYEIDAFCDAVASGILPDQSVTAQSIALCDEIRAQRGIQF